MSPPMHRQVLGGTDDDALVRSVRARPSLLRPFFLIPILLCLPLAVGAPVALLAGGQDVAQETSARYWPRDEVFGGGALLFNSDDTPVHQIYGIGWERPASAEVHARDTDVIFVFQGGATVVTGGEVLEPRSPREHETLGSGIQGGDYSSVLWSGGSLIDLGTLGGSRAAGNAVSDNGLVVGWSNLPGQGSAPFAVLWDGDQVVPLGGLVPGGQSNAKAVNSSGWVTGWAHTASGTSHAFVWDGTEMIDLGALPGSTSDYSMGWVIYDDGTVLGQSTGPDGLTHIVRWSLATSALDTDEDGVPDAGDNCPWVPNGPNEPTGPPTWGNQADSLQFPGQGCACLCGDPERSCAVNIVDSVVASIAGLPTQPPPPAVPDNPPLPLSTIFFDEAFCDINADGE